MNLKDPTPGYWRKASFTHYFEAKRFAAWLVEQGYKTHGNGVPVLKQGKGFYGFHYGPDKEGVKRLEYTEQRNVFTGYRGTPINL